jgi:hypothetical protein
MARDLTADLDKLGEQLADLRGALMKQANASAGDAASYLAPRARKAVKQFSREGYRLSDAARHNPSAATGAVLGALALGAVLALLLAGGSRESD